MHDYRKVAAISDHRYHNRAHSRRDGSPGFAKVAKAIKAAAASAAAARRRLRLRPSG